MNDDVKAVIIATLSGFICVYNTQSITVALPYMTSSLGINSVFANWISLIFLITCAATGLSAGKIMPKYGVIKTTSLCMVFTIIGSIVSVITLNPFLIILGKGIQGFFASGIFVTAYIILIKQIDPFKVGRGLGISTSGFFIAYLIAPIVGGLLSTYVSWQSVFLFVIPFCVLELVLLISFNNEWVEDYNLDKLGAILWFITMTAFVYGVSFLDNFDGKIFFIFSLILMVIFVLYELRTDNPLYDFKLLKNLKYSINNYASMMSCFIVDGIIFVLTLYLQYVKSLSSVETGFVMGLIALVLLIMSPISGRLSDKFSEISLSNWGLIIMLISLVVLAFANYIPLYLIIIALIVLSIGYGIFDTPTRKMIFNTIDDDSKLPDVSAFLSTIRDIGTLISIAAFTLILGIFSGIKVKAQYWAVSTEYILIIFVIVAISIILLTCFNNRKSV